ncbi:MAG: MFS transporter [Clostridia bacterium]|nr:MFS transporter [Clostridia bacterium]
MQQTKMRSFLHNHYHWIVAGIMFLMVFAYSGAGNNLVSLHIAPVSEYLGITRAEFTVTGSARTVVSMISTFLSGFLISKFGIRLSSGLGMMAGTVGYLILSQLRNVTMLTMGNALLGISAGLCSTSAAVFVARVWFHRHSGTVLGVITAASGIGAGILCAIQTAAIETVNFRASYLICAVTMGVGGLLVLLFVRNKPQDMGLLPLGYGEKVTGRRSTSRVGFAGYSMQELLKRPTFYLMFFCVSLSTIAAYFAFTVLRPFVVDCGYSAAKASTVQSLMMLILTVVKILTGYLNDHIGGRKVFMICLLSAILSMALLGWTENYILIVVAVIIYTCCLPLTTLAAPLLATDLFGYQAQAQYTGILLSVIAVTSFFGEYLTNRIYDHMGSYHLSFLLGAALSVISLLLLFILCKAEKKKEG